MRAFSPAEASLLSRFQADFPLHERPFRVVGDGMGLSDDEVLPLARRLKEEGVLRDITGIFNADRLGYHTALAAFRVPAAVLEKTAEVVGAHPGVGHNYERDGAYNLWFTIAVERDVPLEKETEILAARAGVEDFLVLRNEKTLKIGVILPVGDGGRLEGRPGETAPAETASRKRPAEGSRTPGTLSDSEKEVVRVLQKDLPLENRPFHALAERSCADFGGTELLRAAVRLREAGILRRYAAVLRHHKAGYNVNIMSAWRFPEGGEKRLACFIAEPRVTHLYLRSPLRGAWTLNLFAMMHAKSAGEGENLVARLAEGSGLSDYLLLRTKREFKKKKIEYLGEPFSLLKRMEA